MYQHTIITGSIALLITASAFAGTPEKKTAPASKPKSYYRAPSSYSTTRDPDVPKYAKPAPKTGASFLRDAHWLDIGLDYRLRAEYRDGDIRRDAPANQWLQHSQAAARPIPKKPGRFRAGPVRSGDAVVTGPNACCHADRDTEPRPGRA